MKAISKNKLPYWLRLIIYNLNCVFLLFFPVIGEGNGDEFSKTFTKKK